MPYVTSATKSMVGVWNSAEVDESIIESGMVGKMGHLGKYPIFSLADTFSQVATDPLDVKLTTNRYQVLNRLYRYRRCIPDFCLIPQVG